MKHTCTFQQITAVISQELSRPSGCLGSADWCVLMLLLDPRQARKNTFNYCLAFSAVFIAVSLVATAHTVYRFTPIFFLSIAEYTVRPYNNARRQTGKPHCMYCGPPCSIVELVLRSRFQEHGR